MTSFNHQRRRGPFLKPLLFIFFISAPLLLLSLLFRSSSSSTPSPSTTVLTTTTNFSPSLRLRRSYPSYESYISHQLNKTLNPRLRSLWLTRDWSRKVRVFTSFFSDLRQTFGILPNTSRALCIGARMGQEVAALRSLGVVDAIGMDLVPNPPLVVQGDFHNQPFENNTFDFEFSNVFDHALYPDRFVTEIERTLKPGGIAVLHVAVKHKGDKYSANDLFGVDGLVGLFKRSEVVRTRNVDGFGLDTEIVLRKKKKNSKDSMRRS